MSDGNGLQRDRDEAVNCGDMKRVQELLDLAIARIRELEAEREWKPIETALKDGTRFLAYQADREPKYYECWWAKDEATWVQSFRAEPNPSHWQLLPPSPKEWSNGQPRSGVAPDPISDPSAPTKEGE